MKPKLPTTGVRRPVLLICISLSCILPAAAQSGVWTGTTSGGLWSDAANWAAGTIANGAGNSATFSIDLVDPPPHPVNFDPTFVVALDTPRTIGSIVFGDTDPSTSGSWLIDNNFVPENVLTLAGTAAITVNPLGEGARAEIGAPIAGTQGLTKAGAGTLILSGANTYTGGTNLNAGQLNLHNADAIGTGPLVIAGGALGNSSFAAVALNTNNPVVLNSDLIYNGPGNLNLGTGSVTSSGLREFNVNAGVLTVGGVVTAPGFTKTGAGEILLTADNRATLDGPILIKEGTVRLGGGDPNDQFGIGAVTNLITFEGGSLALNGSTGSTSPTMGVLSNPIFIGEGQTGTIFHAQRAAITSTLTGSGTLNLVVRYVRGDLNGNWNGFTGEINVTAGGGNDEFRINGTNHFTNSRLHLGPGVFMHQVFNPPNNAVGTTQNIGALSGDAGSILGAQPVGGRFVNWTVGSLNLDTTFAGLIRNDLDPGVGLGEARLFKVGTGVLTLLGQNTYTGATEINSGTLAIGDGGATGSLGNTNVTVAPDATLVFNRDASAPSTYPGILSGAGAVVKRGAGTVNFNGANTYTAGTVIEGGIIGINSTSSLGDPAGAVSFTTSNGGIMATAPAIASGRTFAIAPEVTASFGAATPADSLEVTSPISGQGSVAINGNGITTFSAGNSYAGGTNIGSGTLVVANASGSATSTGAVTVSGGTLAGSGTISGPVTVAAGGSVRPGVFTSTTSGAGTLATGSLSLAGGSRLFIEIAGPASTDKILVTNAGGLTTSGASAANPILVDVRQENSAGKWITPGTFTIAEFAGTFTGDADALFEVSPESKQTGLTYSFVVQGNALRLVIQGAEPSIWNVDASGNWNLAGNWLNGIPNGTGVVAQLGDKITAARTITLGTGHTVGFLQFNNTNSYTIAGSGTLTLDQAEGNAQIGVLNGSHVISTNLHLADTLDIVMQHPESTLSLLGNISGPGGNVKSSVGNLVLGGSNSFSGNVIFSNGVLEFANGGLGAGSLSLDTATLKWSDGNTQDISNQAITFGENAIAFSMNGNVTLAGNFGGGGAASLTKEGFGNLTISGDPTFEGLVTVADGSLTLGNAGTTGSVLGNIDLTGDGALLRINRSGSAGIPNVISGVGGLRVSGGGTARLMAENTFSGNTTIDAGTTLALENNLALRNSTLVYVNAGGTLDTSGLFGALSLGGLEGDKDLELMDSGGSLAFTVGGNGDSTVYSGVLSGDFASLTKVGSGRLTLEKPQLFTGATTVSAGSLELAAGSSIDTTSANVGAGAALLLINGGSLTAGNATSINAGGAGGLHLLSGSATFNGGLSDTNNDGGLILVEGGALTTSSLSFGRTQSYGNGVDPAPAAVGAGAGLVANGGVVSILGNFTLGTSNSSASSLVNGGSVTVGGVTNIGMTSNNRWSRLEVRDGSFTSTSEEGIQLSPRLDQVNRSQILVTGGTATVERIAFGADGLTLDSIGRLTVDGFGELYIGAGGLVQPATGSFTSQVQLFGGTLGAKAAWSSSLSIATANEFTIKAANAANSPFNITLSGEISGTGTLVKTGAGTLSLTGDHAYGGGTRVEQGTLNLGSASLSDTGTVEILNGATLGLTHGAEDVVGGLMINGAPLGAGTYNSTTHPGLISGTGSLVVFDSPFTIWMQGFPSLTGANAAKQADPDSDGLTNFQEFAFDSNPASSASSGKFRSGIEEVDGETALVITLPVREGAFFDGNPGKSAVVDGVLYSIRGSNDLAFHDQTVTEVIADTTGLPSTSSGWSYRSFRLAGAVGGDAPRGPRGFLEADAEEAP